MIVSTVARFVARQVAAEVVRRGAVGVGRRAVRAAARRAADPVARRAAAEAVADTAETVVDTVSTVAGTAAALAGRALVTGAAVAAGIGAGVAGRVARGRDGTDADAPPVELEADATMDATTHFGYRTVDRGTKASLVGEVFDSVAPSYDVMNDLMSFGIHRAWKRFAIEQSAVRPGQRVLDIAGGTGDLTERLARRVGSGGQVLLADINAAMLRAGRERLVDAGVVGNVHYVQSDAEALPFADDTFDGVTIAFGLRNVTDKARALGSMHRVLKPGGRLIVLEFSKPVLPLLARAYDAYSFTALPLMGRFVAGDADSYRYLAESIRMHPDQQTLASMMTAADFERVEYHNLTGGIVALHKGFKF